MAPIYYCTIVLYIYIWPHGVFLHKSWRLCNRSENDVVWVYCQLRTVDSEWNILKTILWKRSKVYAWCAWFSYLITCKSLKKVSHVKKYWCNNDDVSTNTGNDPGANRVKTSTDYGTNLHLYFLVCSIYYCTNAKSDICLV